MQTDRRNISDISISIAVPAYNEQDVLEEFYKRLRNVIDASKVKWEVVYINDGSRDDTLNVILNP